MNPFEMVAVIVIVGGIISVVGHLFHGGITTPFEMVAVIVVVALLARILMHFIGMKGGMRGRRGRFDNPDLLCSKAELQPHLDKIDTLEKRVRVRERIVTDKTHSLAREIDDLD